MERKPTIYVIIPVYKAEKYIAQTLDSVLSQPYPNIKIICVDDGSPDDSISILRDYEKRYENVHVIRQENGGVSKARNTGIEYVLSCCEDGDFVAFLDADDLWTKNALNEELLHSCCGIDCVGFVSYMCTNDTSRCERMPHQEEKTVSGGPNSIWLHHQFHFAAMLYSCRLLRRFQVRFIEGLSQSEDQIFRFSCVYLAEQIKLIDAPLYCYRANPVSLSHSRKYGIDYLAPIIRGQYRTYEFLQPYADGKRGEPAFLKVLCGLYAIEMAAEHYQMLRSTKSLRTYLSENPDIQNAIDELRPQDLDEHHLALYQMYHRTPTRFILHQYWIGMIRKLYQLICTFPPVVKLMEHRKYPIVNSFL